MTDHQFAAIIMGVIAIGCWYGLADEDSAGWKIFMGTGASIATFATILLLRS